MVTGAASGIGDAITRSFLKEGIHVVGLDVQHERLEINATSLHDKLPGTLHPLQCDLARDGDVEKSFAWIEQNLGGVDILVNNAGVVNYTKIVESDRKVFGRLLNINVLAVAVCTREAVRSMRVRNVEGHVFNVNSLLGHEIPRTYISDAEGCDGWNLYPSCKHATLALTNTVRHELRHLKAPIRITSISPGLVKTEIAKKVEGMKDFFENTPALEPQDVADSVMYALGTRPEVQICEILLQRTGE